MSAKNAMVLAKHRFLRRFYFGGLAIMTAIAGVGITYAAICDYAKSHNAYCVPAIPLGVALPFIIAGGEWLRLRRAAKKIERVECRKCGGGFSYQALYKAGRCPACRSKKVTGYTADGIRV